MAIRLGDEAPNFQAETTEGNIDFHKWIGDNWAVLFSHPADYTPVCTTELGYTAKLKPEFDKRGVKTIAVSVDPIDDHQTSQKINCDCQCGLWQNLDAVYTLRQMVLGPLGA